MLVDTKKEGNSVDSSILNPNYTKLVVMNTKTGEEYAVITGGDTPITTASDDIVVKLTPRYD